MCLFIHLYKLWFLVSTVPLDTRNNSDKRLFNILLAESLKSHQKMMVQRRTTYYWKLDQYGHMRSSFGKRKMTVSPDV